MGFGNVAPAPFSLICPTAGRARIAHTNSSTSLRISNNASLECMSSFYRRRVTGLLQRSEFLMNGCCQALENADFNAQIAGGQFRAGTECWTETRALTQQAFQAHAACLSRARKQWPAECAQRVRGNARAQPWFGGR